MVSLWSFAPRGRRELAGLTVRTEGRGSAVKYPAAKDFSATNARQPGSAVAAEFVLVAARNAVAVNVVAQRGPAVGQTGFEGVLECQYQTAGSLR